MSLRFYLPGTVWTIVMTVLFLASTKDLQQTEWCAVPISSVMHVFLFAGFVHIWCVGLKKQSKYRALKRIAIPLLFVIAVFYGTLIEFLQAAMTNGRQFEIKDIVYDALGAYIGTWSFRLVYRSCY